MKLIKVTEAAELLGVSHETVKNWGKKGILRVQKIGAGNSHWVDADTIKSLGDTVEDIKHASIELDSIKEEIIKKSAKERELLQSLRNDILLLENYEGVSFYTEFLLSIVDMAHSLELINNREYYILYGFIQHGGLWDYVYTCGVSHQRVLEIFHKACVKTKNVAQLKSLLDERTALIKENGELKDGIASLSKELKFQREEEAKLRELDERERIEQFKATDEKNKIFNTRIVDCNISVRAITVLKAADCWTIGDVCKMNKLDLMKYRNCGRKTISECEDLLDSMGLSFGMDVDKIYRDRLSQVVHNVLSEKE